MNASPSQGGEVTNGALGAFIIASENLIKVFFEFLNCYADLLNVLVLIVIAYGGWKQLKDIREQNELSRIVSWKSSIQDVNSLIFKYPKYFHPVLYPPDQEEEDVMQTTAAYASLNALETIYHMRKGEGKGKVDEIKRFLRAYVYESDPIKELWKNPAFPSAFTAEFQKEIDDIVLPHTISNTTSKKKAPEADESGTAPEEKST